MEFTFPENALIRRFFTDVLPQSKPVPSSCNHALGKGKENYPFLEAAFFRKFVSSNSRKGWRKL